MVEKKNEEPQGKKDEPQAKKEESQPRKPQAREVKQSGSRPVPAPPVNSVRVEDNGKVADIPAPNSENRELKENARKHSEALDATFRDDSK